MTKPKDTVTYRLILAAFLGYTVGSLPTSSTAWDAIHLAFSVTLLVLLIVALRHKHGTGGNDG